MLPISLRNEVTRALMTDWPEFAARHPHLARAIDRALLVEQAVACIADTPEYAHAMEEAALAGASAAMLREIVGRFVRQWLANLI